MQNDAVGVDHASVNGFDRFDFVDPEGTLVSVFSIEDDIIAAALSGPDDHVELEVVPGPHGTEELQVSIQVSDDGATSSNEVPGPILEQHRAEFPMAFSGAESRQEYVDDLTEMSVDQFHTHAESRQQEEVMQPSSFAAPAGMSPSLPIHSTLTATVNHSNAYAYGAITRYIIPENDPNYVYVSDESQVSCRARDRDSLVNCVTRHDYGGALLVRWNPGADRPGTDGCSTSSVGYTLGGAPYPFSMTASRSYAACSSKLGVQVNANSLRVEWQGRVGTGTTRESVAATHVRRPNNGDTLLTYKISVRTCWFTCTSYGPGIGS